jgi:DNA transformation protein and related proteins
MPVSDAFVDYVLDQLDGCGPVTARRMFGGAGLYAQDLFFGIIADDVLYLKADEETRKRYVKARMPAFKPYPNRPSTMKYYQVPVGVLESSTELNMWAREAIAVARRTKARKMKADARGR